MKVKDRKAWADNLWGSLESKLKGVDKVVFLAGSKYREYLFDKIKEKGISINIPMFGLRPGEQLQWLKNNTKGE